MQPVKQHIHRLVNSQLSTAAKNSSKISQQAYPCKPSKKKKAELPQKTERKKQNDQYEENWQAGVLVLSKRGMRSLTTAYIV